MTPCLIKLVTKQVVGLRNDGKSDENIVQIYLDHDVSAGMLLVVCAVLSNKAITV